MAITLGTGSTLVLGGARSGKSRFAEGLVLGSGLKPVYVATADAGDDEMAARIADHRARRGAHWMTVEEPVDLAAVLHTQAGSDAAVLVDCLTLWLTNLMMAGSDIDSRIEDLAGAIPALAGPVVFVSNEVGLGLVPDNAMGRAFRDHAGRLNQAVAEQAARVYFIAAGLPLALKQ